MGGWVDGCSGCGVFPGIGFGRMSEITGHAVGTLRHPWCCLCAYPLTLPLPLPLSQIYSVDSHRLALALDSRGMLLQIVRSAVLHAMGLSNKDSLRLANLF